jgi:hypothetical protein
MITKRNVIRFSMSVASAVFASSVFAQSGGQPLVLDTQTGIHTGVGGTVLQTGPLTSHEMVQAPSVAGVPASPQQNQPVIEVTPYIGVPQHGGASAGKSSGTSASSRQRMQATPSRVGATPMAMPPMIAAMPASPATQPSRSSGPHIVSGPITAPRQ